MMQVIFLNGLIPKNVSLFQKKRTMFPGSKVKAEATGSVTFIPSTKVTMMRQVSFLKWLLKMSNSKSKFSPFLFCFHVIQHIMSVLCLLYLCNFSNDNNNSHYLELPTLSSTDKEIDLKRE